MSLQGNGNTGRIGTTNPAPGYGHIIGFSCSSYVPTSHTGKGIPNVFAPMDFFNGHSPLNTVVIAQKNHAVRQTFF
jgi:hypothetical protein